MKLKKIIFSSTAFLILISLCSADAQSIDLNKNELFIKKGFSADWIRSIPDDNSWKVMPPSATGRRTVRVKNLGLKDTPQRKMFSFVEYPPETFTFITCFKLEKERISSGEILGLKLAQIGINWEIYVNGHLIRSEIHLDSDGSIAVLRNLRSLLVYINPIFLKPGENILAFRIVGDPSLPDTGFYRSYPYVIDEYTVLLKKNSETAALLLLFLYLFVGLYHLFLFAFRTDEKFNLFYGLFSISLFIYMYSNTIAVYSIIANTGFLQRIESIALFCLFPLGCGFIDFMLPRKISKFTIGYSMFCGVLMFLSLFTPYSFLNDLNRLWQAFAILPMMYMFIVVGYAFYKNIIRYNSASGSDDNIREMFSSIYRALSRTAAGNLFVGIIVITGCVVFDIIDSIYLSIGVGLSKYGFFVIMFGVALILANRFLYIHKRVENLNLELQDKIEDLNELNRKMTVSEEKYQLLIEGTNDIIFSLDEDLKFINVNLAIYNHLFLSPDEVRNKSFFDLLYDGSSEMTVVKQLVQKKITQLSMGSDYVNFKVQFKSAFMEEPKEMHVRLEGVNIEGKNEILGKASSFEEDSLLKYFISERQKYIIGNFLLTAEEVSHRLTRNLTKYIEPKKASFIRVALREMIINSIEHGNLNISFDEKTDASRTESYIEYLAKRQADARYSDKKVIVDYSVNPERVAFKITDEGSGFDYRKVLNRNKDENNINLLTHGRGIMMANGIFDELRYNRKGNQVLLIKYFE